MCQKYLDVNARSDDMHSGFICAGGKGREESCYVSVTSINIWPGIVYIESIFQIAMDGGSPLACQRQDGIYELAGLVTFGTSCSQDKSPSLFTNVSKHSSWIKRNYVTMRKNQK